MSSRKLEKDIKKLDKVLNHPYNLQSHFSRDFYIYFPHVSQDGMPFLEKMEEMINFLE